MKTLARRRRAGKFLKVKIQGRSLCLPPLQVVRPVVEDRARARSHGGLTHSWGYPVGYLGASIVGWVWEIKKLGSVKLGMR